MTRTWTALLCCLAAACGGPDSSGGPDGGPCVGEGCTGPDGSIEPTWSFRDVYGVPNIDNDDGSQTDWNQPPFDGDDDFSTLTLSADALALVPSGGDVELQLSGDLSNIRIFQDGQHVLGVEAAATHTFAPAGGELSLQIEFGDYGVAGQLVISARDSGGAVLETAMVKLGAAPLIMNHHLQPAEHVWALRVNSNASFIASYQTALGDKFTPIPGGSYQGDVWVQDEFEFATLVGDEDQRVDVVIDSIRNRGLDRFPENALVGPDVIAQTWGIPAQATTYDSFGNLEASPPVTVNGVEYPFGKIYYGRTGNTGMSSQLGAFLAAQRVQAPFTLPTTWLCVGHVDEFSSFVPDPASPKGFKLVMADVPAAWALLQSLAPTASIGRYGNDHGFPTVGSILGDADLVALNNDLQTDYLDPITATFKAELGLTDDDIIKVPSLFERVGGCNGRVAALIPGMVNLIVANVDGQTTHLFTADPYFRPSGAAQSADPIITAFTQAMPAGMQLHYIDNWNTYHLGLGEVHCGTNVRRTPTADWWTTAQHLMGGN